MTPEIIKNWNENIIHIKCQTNTINHISIDTLNRFRNIVKINLTDNRLPFINNIFQMNIYLEIIDFSHNKIAYINGTWNTLEKLNYIDLSHNILTKFNIDIFYRFIKNPFKFTLLVSSNLFLCTCNLKWLVNTTLKNNSKCRIISDKWKTDVLKSCSNATKMSCDELLRYNYNIFKDKCNISG